MFRKTTVFLFSLLVLALPTLAQEKPESTLFIYFNNGGIKAFPPECVKEINLGLKSYVTLTLVNDSTVSYFKSLIDSISYYGPELPEFTSFKFNDKYNENLSIDVEAAEIVDTMVISVPAIGKRLTPSFKVSDENARAYIGNSEQQSKVSRLRFDKDITYTVSLPGDSIFAMEKVSDEEWSEEIWSEPIEEIPLRADMLSTNQPSNNPDSEGLDKMLDGDKSTYHQSTWGSGAYTQKSENVCLDIVLDEPVSVFQFYYCSRNLDNYNPLAFTIWAAGDDGVWKAQRKFSIEDGMPTGAGNSEYTSPSITLDGSYNHLRFELTDAEHTKRQADGFVLPYLALAEFRLYKVNGSNRVLIKPSELIHPAVWWYGMKPYGREYTVRVDWLTDRAPGVPRIDIDIDGGQMVSSKNYYLHANFRLDGNGVFEDLEDSIWIKGRGNSSWAGTWGKSPYNIKFNEKVKPFGLTKGKSWCLIANAQRGSMMANAVGMKAARMMGTAGANHVIPVDLYMNGEYRGSYTFTEKVGLRNNSIDADEMTSYMLELDQYYDEDYKFYSSPYSLPVNVKDPDLTEEPFWNDAEERFQIIQEQFNAFTSALMNQDGYEEMIDVEAFARFFMVNNLVNNMELGHPKSTYLYRENYEDPESKFTFGPVWDLDWAFGYENSAQYYVRDAKTSIFSKMTGQSGNNFFMAMLDNSELVRKEHYRAWMEFMRKYYDEFLEYPEDYLSYANSSFLTNADIWNGEGRNYAGQPSQIKKWFDDRTTWIMDNIEVFDLDDENPYLTQGDVNFDGIYSVADVVCLLAYMLGEKPEDFNFRQADVDKNSLITVNDLVYVIEFVMKAETKVQPNRRQTPAEVEFTLNGFEARMGEATDIDIQLMPVEEADKDVTYTAMEFVLTLPEGMTLEKAALIGNLFSHTVTTLPLDERHTRILIYSNENSSITTGDMLRLTVRPDAVIRERDRIITLNNALIATPDGDEHKVHSRVASFGLSTGLDSHLVESRIEGGRVLTITALEATTLHILTADGRLVRTVDVNPGTITVSLPAGIYIVDRTKVVIR